MKALRFNDEGVILEILEVIHRSGKHARNVSEWTFTAKVNDACEE